MGFPHGRHPSPGLGNQAKSSLSETGDSRLWGRSCYARHGVTGSRLGVSSAKGLGPADGADFCWHGLEDQRCRFPLVRNGGGAGPGLPALTGDAHHALPLLLLQARNLPHSAPRQQAGAPVTITATRPVFARDQETPLHTQ